MHKSNKLLILILISILIISAKSYTLKKYDYGQFITVASGPAISKKFEVTKKQLLNFEMTRDEGDSVAVLFGVTSDGSSENIIFYSTFKDEIANENNSNKTIATTPLGISLCSPNVFSFTIQMDNFFLGGDIIVGIRGTSNLSQCNTNALTREESDEFVLVSNKTIKLSDDIEVGETVFYRTSIASTTINQSLIYLIVILLSLQLSI